MCFNLWSFSSFICLLLLSTVEFAEISANQRIATSGMHFKGPFLCVFVTQEDKVGSHKWRRMRTRIKSVFQGIQMVSMKMHGFYLPPTNKTQIHERVWHSGLCRKQCDC